MRRTTVATSIAASLALVAVPTAAFARDYSDSIGAVGYLHVYEDDGYEGQHLQRQSYDTNLGNDDFDDEMSSYINRTGYYWRLFSDSDYRGTSICVKPRSHDGNLGNNTSLEDNISSLKRVGTSASDCGAANIIGTPN